MSLSYTEYNTFENQFWNKVTKEMQEKQTDFKNHQLPLARIKKVMKSDQDVKMISAEAPILFSKGCDLFITELTLRAWEHAVENKRRTLQRSDIAVALSKSDMFDFLIDIVPREEIPPSTTIDDNKSAYNIQQQQQQPFENHYGNYGYGLPPQTQYMMNEQQHQLYLQQQQQQQEQLLNQQLYKQTSNNTN